MYSLDPLDFCYPRMFVKIMKIDLEKLGTGSSSLDEYHLNSFKVFGNFDNDLKILVFCFLRRYILLFILEYLSAIIDEKISLDRLKSGHHGKI